MNAKEDKIKSGIVLKCPAIHINSPPPVSMVWCADEKIEEHWKHEQEEHRKSRTSVREER